MLGVRSDTRSEPKTGNAVAFANFDAQIAILTRTFDHVLCWLLSCVAI